MIGVLGGILSILSRKREGEMGQYGRIISQ